MAEIETGYRKDELYDAKVVEDSANIKAADRVIATLRKWTKRLGDKALEAK